MAVPAGDPIRRAMWLDELDRRFHPLLPRALAPHTRVANYEQGRLVFLVDSPVWRAKLRLLAPQLLDTARSLGLDAKEVVVRTSLAPAPPPAPKHRPVTMSDTARKSLQAALASLRAPDEGKPGPDDAS
nr:DUF721 domain-containing protein [Lysobacter sp. GX 14042]